MGELDEAVAALRGEGGGIGRAIVVRSFGSAPRPEGATLLVADDGRIAGSVSGGCVEGAAFEEGVRGGRAGGTRGIPYGITAAPAGGGRRAGRTARRHRRRRALAIAGRPGARRGADRRGAALSRPGRLANRGAGRTIALHRGLPGPLSPRGRWRGAR